MRTLLGICVSLLVCGLCRSQPGMTVIQLKWADAETVAAMFSDQAPPRADELRGYRQKWVDDLAGRVARRLPRDLSRVQPQWHYASTITSAPREQIGGHGAGAMARFLPEGLAGPPVVLMNQNALLAKGTPAAIDQLRELIALIDVKPRMVNIEAKMVDAPTSRTNEWGIDFGTRAGDLIISSRGNAPATGLQTRFRVGNTDATLGWDRTRSSGQTLTAANLTTTNNFPAIITLGRMMPFFTSSVSYDYFGNRHVDTQVDAIFIGTELFVQPRINSNDTITMFIRPTFIEAVGTVIGPNGMTLPITETVGTETKVTVRDGETIQIGGFERSLQQYNTKFSGFLRGREVSVNSHPTLFVTPRIIRDLEGVLP